MDSKDRIKNLLNDIENGEISYNVNNAFAILLQDFIEFCQNVEAPNLTDDEAFEYRRELLADFLERIQKPHKI